MPMEIGEYVVSGELSNSRHNSVVGWLQLVGDASVRIELTGNLAGAIRGTSVKFVRHDKQNDELVEAPEQIQSLAHRQIGVVSDMSQPGDNALHLEWQSQNGHVLAELQDFEIAIEDDADGGAASDAPGLDVGVTEIFFGDEDVLPDVADESLDSQLFDDGEDLDAEDLDGEDEEEDPFGLFDSGLEAKLAESLESDFGKGDSDSDSPDSSSVPPEVGNYANWQSMDLDPETQRMYEQWDEIFAGQKDEPLSYLFDKPLKLPRPSAVDDPKVAWPLVVAILAQLAKLSVALDVCEHYDAVQTYELLMDEILPNAKVHPNLAASEMVQHYSTSEHCKECQDAFDAEYEARNNPPKDSDEDQ
ncbi:MAG: hypothetical protein Aurels2KO_42280 [Aureliella sp.]